MKTKLLAYAISGIMATSLLTACGGSDNNEEKQTTTNYTKVSFKPTGSFTHAKKFDDGAAEITAFHPQSKHGFVVNASNGTVDVLDLTDPTKPILKKSIDVSDVGASVNSVAVHGDMVALAVEAHVKQDNGFVVLLDANTLEVLGKAKVGALPDMVTFTNGGKYVLSANEGEPSKDYKNDPEGSVSIIDVTNPTKPVVTTANFKAYIGQEDSLNNKGVRIFGNHGKSNAAQDLEPEYIAISGDDKTAYVALQENNAIAIIDIATATVTDIKSLGYKDHSLAGNELDTSNKDDTINITTRPVLGMYMPDGMVSYTVGDKTYLVTANEGDAREYEYKDGNGDKIMAYAEEADVKDLALAPDLDAACGDTPCSDKTVMGKLTVTTTMGKNKAGVYDTLYSFGARSFSIWDASDMSLVYDSGSELAKLMATKYPANFNASNDDNSLDDRSDNKGAEPEGVVLGKVGSQTIAFIGLERMSSVVAYDVTKPTAAKFMGEINTRKWKWTEDDFKAAKDGKDNAPEVNADGDLGPEGLAFISAKDSPNGKPLLFVGYEISGTSRIFELNFSEK